MLCSAILTLPGIFSVAARPCSHVELWKKCLLPEVGSVAAPVAFHVLFTVQGEPCSSPGELSHGQGGVWIPAVPCRLHGCNRLRSCASARQAHTAAAVSTSEVQLLEVFA